MDARIKLWADAIRLRFDTASRRCGSAALVCLLGCAVAGVAMLQNRALVGGCGELLVSIMRLEVTFSARTYFALLSAASDRCAAAIVHSFISWDLLFPLVYGPLLSALYVWAERWRRFNPKDQRRDATDDRRRDVLVLVPLLAAALDIVAENLPLWFAGHNRLMLHAAEWWPNALAVNAGSLGATAKWLLLLLWAGGILLETFTGARRAILWRVRFSVLAVLLGSLPLLLIAQGQDILQRSAETGHPFFPVLGVPFGMLGVAVAVWYAARKLTELDLADLPPSDDAMWCAEYATHIPRLLGVAAVILPAVAFARAGDDLTRFVVVAIGGAGLASLGSHFQPRLVKWLGRRTFAPRGCIRRTDAAAAVGRVDLAVVIAGVGLVLASRTPEEPIRDLRLAAYVALILAWVFQLFVRFRRSVPALNAALPAPLSPTPPLNRTDPAAPGHTLRLLVAGMAVMSATTFLLFVVAPVPVARALGAMGVLSLAVLNALFFGSLTVWANHRYRIRCVTTATVVALLFSIWNDGHAVRSVPLTNPGAIAERKTVAERFDEWIATYHRDARPADVPVVLVAAAGGGLRAAHWTAMSLAAIADAAPTFRQNLFALSGVSGGSLGGVLFTALARDRQPDDGGYRCQWPARGPSPRERTSGFYGTCVHDFMRDDYLSPVIAKLVAPDFIQLFTPLSVKAFDRSTGLEEAWRDSYQRLAGSSTVATNFLSFAADDRGTAPVVLLNSTHVESGRRYITASVVRDHRNGVATPFQDAGDVLDTIQRDLPLWVAVHNSARFTYVSPAGRLEPPDGATNPVPAHVVDGGYFENSGLATLREVYDVLSRREIRPWVLYLCNDPNGCDRRDPQLSRQPSTTADEVAAPLQTLLKTRDARGSLAETALKELAGDRFLTLNVCRDFNSKTTTSPSQSAAVGAGDDVDFVKRQRTANPPLGWLLSGLAQDWMDRSLGGEFGDDGDCQKANAAAFTTLVGVLGGDRAEGRRDRHQQSPH